MHDSIRPKLIALYRLAILKGMPIEELEEKVRYYLGRMSVSSQIEVGDDEVALAKAKKVPRLVRLGSLALPLVFIVTGMYLVGNAVIPILGYYFTTIPELQVNALTSPIPQDQVMEVTPLVVTQTADDQTADQDQADGPVIINESLDYTNLANWFTGPNMPGLTVIDDASPVVEYTIDIPKLEIANAKVTVGGSDLNKSLIHYPGTALPGQDGAPVIFGHSVLRQFYNPNEKNPRRYNSIFSYIMTLQPGDKIFVTVDGVKYTYQVQSKTVVEPEEVSILTQQYDVKRLKLVTCVPEGTYAKRGVVIAQLVPG